MGIKGLTVATDGPIRGPQVILRVRLNCENHYMNNVFFKFRRPINWIGIKPRFLEILQVFRKSAAHEPDGYAIGNNFWFSISKASVSRSSVFVLGGCLDLDSGGFIVSELLRNIL